MFFQWQILVKLGCLLSAAENKQDKADDGKPASDRKKLPDTRPPCVHRKRHDLPWPSTFAESVVPAPAAATKPPWLWSSCKEGDGHYGGAMLPHGGKSGNKTKPKRRFQQQALQGEPQPKVSKNTVETCDAGTNMAEITVCSIVYFIFLVVVLYSCTEQNASHMGTPAIEYCSSRDHTWKFQSDYFDLFLLSLNSYWL